MHQYEAPCWAYLEMLPGVMYTPQRLQMLLVCLCMPGIVLALTCCRIDMYNEYRETNFHDAGALEHTKIADIALCGEHVDGTCRALWPKIADTDGLS